MGRLLGFSRPREFRLVTADLRHVVQETVAMLRRVVPEDIEMDVVTEDAVAAPCVDVNTVQQMLTNLVPNARGGSSIGVRCAVLHESQRGPYPWLAPGRYVCVAMRDNGVGMDDATRAQVFEPFFTTKPPGKGTRLGLPMVYDAIKQHGGLIQLRSAPGEGTILELYLPGRRVRRGAGCRIPAGSRSAGLRQRHDSLGGGQRGPAARGATGAGAAGISRDRGSRRRGALAVPDAEIDLVLSDAVMPKCGGAALYRAVRAQNERVKFLLSSGYTSEDVRERADLNSGVPFIQEPWTLAELARGTRRALDM